MSSSEADRPAHPFPVGGRGWAQGPAERRPGCPQEVGAPGHAVLCCLFEAGTSTDKGLSAQNKNVIPEKMLFPSQRLKKYFRNKMQYIQIKVYSNHDTKKEM